MISFLQRIYFFPFRLRKTILFIFDFIVVFFTLILNCNLININNANYTIDYNYLNFFIISVFILTIYALTGHYKSITRFNGSITFYYSFLRNLFIIFILALFTNFFLPDKYELRFWINLIILLPLSINFYRFILRDVFYFLGKSSINSNRVLIYGADEEGAQLANFLMRSGKYKVIAILDSLSQVLQRNINSIPIMSIDDFLKSNLNFNIDKVYLSKRNLNRAEKFSLNKVFRKYGIKILKVSSDDYVKEEGNILENLETISIDDLLGRDAVNPDPNLLGPGIKGKSVCVTGAAGSIGGELVSQLKDLQPEKVVIIDQNEHGLYQINQRLQNLNLSFEVIPVLGTLLDNLLLENLIDKFDINIIFHAAAYKHVPLVEINPLQGIYNNVFSTKKVCEVAYKKNIKKVILISTDKAVRPTNIMGASKRISELVVQGFSELSKNNKKSKCCFSIVRFGNVLGSSGSVVPLFKKQISHGGPITLTHPDIIRYFMSIREAAQLVIQSAFLAEGGEVFLLDMGKPIKIRDLAEQMILLSGLTIKDENSPNGDIEISISGLRAGEKLFEELLIGENSSPTKHPLIFKANEEFIEPEKLFNELSDLEIFLKNRSLNKVKFVVKNLVPEWECKN